ncbi:MAG: extracellular solute-binding protein [Chloroflexota bacterium]
MTELNFSLYSSQPLFLERISTLLKEFETQHHIPVRANQQNLDESWSQLFQYVLYGGGPDISRIGTIWTSSLVALNALRPFAPKEVAALGGANAFFDPVWQSCSLQGDARIWSIPFTVFNYALFYRRDLLNKAGIDAQVAFASAPAMLETLQRLQASGIHSAWVTPSGQHYRARLHVAVSWLWGAGGHLLSDDGRHFLANQPQALAGLESFFELFRCLSPDDYGLTSAECLQRFAQGRTAVYIGGPDTIARMREFGPPPGILENVGTTILPGTPWIGGSSLVVWKDVLSDPKKERAALQLISFLTQPLTQIKLYNLCEVLPSRREALAQLQLEPVELLQVERKVLETGRSYRPYPIWMRIQNDLILALDAITADILADSSLDIAAAISRHLDPLARKYEMTLESF